MEYLTHRTLKGWDYHLSEQAITIPKDSSLHQLIWRHQVGGHSRRVTLNLLGLESLLSMAKAKFKTKLMNMNRKMRWWRKCRVQLKELKDNLSSTNSTWLNQIELSPILGRPVEANKQLELATSGMIWTNWLLSSRTSPMMMAILFTWNQAKMTAETLMTCNP